MSRAAGRRHPTRPAVRSTVRTALTVCASFRSAGGDTPSDERQGETVNNCRNSEHAHMTTHQPTGPYCWPTDDHARKVTAQVAVEAVVDNPSAYDESTRTAVRWEAVQAGVHKRYVAMLDDLA